MLPYVVAWLQDSGRLGQPVSWSLSTRCRQSTEAAKPELTLKTPPPPPPPPPPKKSGFFGKLVGLSLFAVGGTVGYAWYDPKFKQKISDNVPYSKEALDYALQYLPPPAGTEGSPVPKLKSITGGTGPVATDKEEKGLARPIISSPPPPEKEPEKKVLTPAEEKAKVKEDAARKKVKDKLAAEQNKQEEKERIQNAIRQKEEDDAVENTALETILANMIEDAEDVLKMAVLAQKAAAQAVKQHTQQVKDAMDLEQMGDKEKQWEATAASNRSRADAIDAADKMANSARMQFEKLMVGIQDGKQSAVTKRNKALREAEKKLSNLTYSLNSAVAENTKAQSAAKVMADYRDLVKKGKNQFKQELESIMPDVKLGNRFGGRLTDEELNSLIAHAHRRIEQLQRQLAEQLAMEQMHIEAALEKQKEEDEKLSDSRVEREEKRLQENFSVEKQTWDVEARIQFEQELRQHLSRQAAAHSDHLADVLKVQERELQAEYEVLLNERILEERDKFHTDVAGWISRMKGIEAAVEARAEMEKTGRKAQELWLACQTLQTVIQQGRSGATTWEGQLQPLESELEAIKLAGDSHPFVTSIVESMPDTAALRGVWTEDALVDRFSKVRHICRRMAMVGEEGASSLLSYFLSYIQSFFVFTSAKIIGNTEEIDLADMSTFVLVDNAYYCLQRGDLQQAVKYINLLKGQPRVVAGDWLSEAQLLLETQQAADALLAHASASGLGSLF